MKPKRKKPGIRYGDSRSAALALFAKASEFIRPLADLPDGSRVIVVCRKSNRDRSGSLADQVANLTAVLKARGMEIVGTRSRGSWWGGDAAWLLKASDDAKRLDAVLVAESTSRFVRCESYHPSKNPSAKPMRDELEHLQRWTQGVPLYTDLDPDASPEQERAHQTQRRGKSGGSKRGGRPPKAGWKVARRKRLSPKARKMRKDGASYNEIAKQLGVPRSTIQAWV